MRHANVGGADRIIRIVAGAALVFGPYVLTSLPVWDSDNLRIAIQLAGTMLVFTGVFGFSMIYKFFRYKTNES